MKKVSFMMIAAFVAVSSMFVSCSSDEEIEHATISFDNVTGDKVTLDAGASSYVMNVTIESPVENLKTIRVSKKVGSETTAIGNQITTFDSKTKHHLSMGITGITEDCEVIVTVDNGTEYSKTLTIDWTKAAAFVPDFTNAKNSITVAKGNTVHYKQGDKIGKIVITEASTTAISLTFEEKTEVVELSDAGNSYLKKDGTSYNHDAAVTDKGNNLLLAKKSGSAMLCSGKDGGLTTAFADAVNVVFVIEPKTE